MPDPNLNPPWQKAASAAARFHRHQFRKDGATPYVAHPFRVAMTVRDLSASATRSPWPRPSCTT